MKGYLICILILLLYGGSVKSQRIYEIEVGARKMGRLILEEKNTKQYSAYIQYTFFKGKPTTAKSFLSKLFTNMLQ